MEVAGQDSTEAFLAAGHSEEACEILESLLVGTLRGHSEKASATSLDSTSNPSSTTPHDVPPKSTKELFHSETGSGPLPLEKSSQCGDGECSAAVYVALAVCVSGALAFGAYF